MTKDNEKIKELIRLSEENPELEIIPATYYEVAGEDWGYWKGKIEKVAKEYFYDKDNSWVAGDRSEILDDISDNICDYPEYENMPDKEFLEKVEERFNYLVSENKIKEAIIIYIGLP